MPENQLSHLLGPLEVKVMNILWKNSEGTVQEVVYELNKNNDYAYTTIMTVMSRLAKKGILLREKSGRSYQYIPAFNPDELVDHLSSQAVKNLLDDFGDTAIAQFVENVKSSPEQLDKLKHFIEQWERDERNEK